MSNNVDRKSDEGAALILILGMIVMVSAVLGGLLGFISTSARGRVALDTTRARQYAADGAIEYAIAQVRNMPMQVVPLRPAESACGPYAHTLNGFSIHVDCANNPRVLTSDGGLLQRNVIFTACAGPVAVCTPATAIIRAQVNFEAGGAPAGSPLTVTQTYVQSWSLNG